MRTTYRYILPAVIAALTLASCSGDDTELNTRGDCPRFSALINGAHSRAADDYWENGDKIGISGDYAINFCYVNIGGDTIFAAESAEHQFYFQNDNPVNFTAYYPYNNSRDANTGLISISTADQSNQKDFDFLWASGTGSKSNPSVQLNFTHRMGKITFTFKNGKDMDVKTLSRCRLNGLAVEGTFDTTTGVCEGNKSIPSAYSYLHLSRVNEDEPVTPLFLFPQTVSGKLKLEIYDTNAQYYACDLTVPDNAIIAGTEYNYIITVNKTGLNVDSCTLSDWITENGEDSEASSSDE